MGLVGIAELESESVRWRKDPRTSCNTVRQRVWCVSALGLNKDIMQNGQTLLHTGSLYQLLVCDHATVKGARISLDL
jgi:hypothetical protein